VTMEHKFGWGPKTMPRPSEADMKCLAGMVKRITFIPLQTWSGWSCKLHLRPGYATPSSVTASRTRLKLALCGFGVTRGPVHNQNGSKRPRLCENASPLAPI